MMTMATTAMMDQSVTPPTLVTMQVPPRLALCNTCTAERLSSVLRTGVPCGPWGYGRDADYTFFSEIRLKCAKGTHRTAGSRYDGQNICTQILFRPSGVRNPGAAHRRSRLLSVRCARSAAVPTRGSSAAPNRFPFCTSVARIAAARRSVRPSDPGRPSHTGVLTPAVVCRPSTFRASLRGRCRSGLPAAADPRSRSPRTRCTASSSRCPASCSSSRCRSTGRTGRGTAERARSWNWRRTRGLLASMRTEGPCAWPAGLRKAIGTL